MAEVEDSGLLGC